MSNKEISNKVPVGQFSLNCLNVIDNFPPHCFRTALRVLSLLYIYISCILYIYKIEVPFQSGQNSTISTNSSIKLWSGELLDQVDLVEFPSTVVTPH